jgi:hypothetical protein
MTVSKLNSNSKNQLNKLIQIDDKLFKLFSTSCEMTPIDIKYACQNKNSSNDIDISTLKISKLFELLKFHNTEDSNFLIKYIKEQHQFT